MRQLDSRIVVEPGPFDGPRRGYSDPLPRYTPPHAITVDGLQNDLRIAGARIRELEQRLEAAERRADTYRDALLEANDAD